MLPTGTKSPPLIPVPDPGLKGGPLVPDACSRVGNRDYRGFPTGSKALFCTSAPFCFTALVTLGFLFLPSQVSDLAKLPLAFCVPMFRIFLGYNNATKFVQNAWLNLV